jgi:NADH-quinone oxidoreductase subunit L
VFLTFYGKPRWAASEHVQHALHDAHGHDHDRQDEPYEEDAAHGAPHAGDHLPATGTGGYHPHESPWSMLVPLLLLSVGAVFAGFVFHGFFIEPEAGEKFWKGSVAFNEHLMHAMHEVPVWVKLSATLAMLSGLIIAWAAYIRAPEFPAKFAEAFRPLYLFSLNKWYFDELYNFLFVRPAFAIGRIFWKRGDEKTIDRFGPNGAARLVQLGSAGAVKLQSGYLYTYAFVMLIGLTAALTWVITR